MIDAVTGQDAVHTARTFHEALALSGLIVTKLDYDARGGAVLSARGVVGRPVVFASTGEKIADFDLFYPERMASRILGMGDVLSLIEQAERTMDPSVVAESAGRMMSGTFTLDDFLAQLNQVRKMGSLGGIMKLMPGVTKEMRTAASNVDEGELNRVEAIVRSMTPKERRDPTIIDGSRRTRIAKGSATSVVGRQPAAQAVRRDEKDDAPDGQRRRAGRCRPAWVAWRHWRRGKLGGESVARGFRGARCGMASAASRRAGAERKTRRRRAGGLPLPNNAKL